MTLKCGKVYIIGAGPGDPGLITVKGADILKTAQVVVYDKLINDVLLNYCPKNCEKIFVGKEPGYHPIKQSEITEILIEKAKEGKIVARLKGGNPFVFGRGSEEAISLCKENIEFEIIPGITSGLAAPIYCGIPITHRKIITQCVFVTAHESPNKENAQVDWRTLAKMQNTSLIIYMGASRIQEISDMLISFGMNPEMPAAVIENGTLPEQRLITSNIKDLPGIFLRNKFHSPSIIMISPTIALRESICNTDKSE